MKKLALVLSVLMLLSGCAGLDIKPITDTDRKCLHTDKNKIKGYVVYAPKIFFEVKNLERNCEIKTFKMPDYSKPFSVNIRAGFGKVDTKVGIKDGWMLGDISANTDNTAVLSELKKTFFDLVAQGEQVTMRAAELLSNGEKKKLQEALEECKKQIEGCKKQLEECKKQPEGCKKQLEECKKQLEGCKKQLLELLEKHQPCGMDNGIYALESISSEKGKPPKLVLKKVEISVLETNKEEAEDKCTKAEDKVNSAS